MNKPKKKTRNPVAWGMQKTCRKQVFRHRANRRPKDARRTQEWKDC